MALTAGSRLGPYEIVSRIGAGGMGEVFKARDTRLGREVALKLLPPELAGDTRLRVRLEREAKIISGLNHPNICTLHDVGRDNGCDYLVMELCEGQTLADRIDRGRLPLDEVLRYGTEIADALSRAHRAGIVHRDLKPSNIVLTTTGAKLLDFGLAKQRSSSETTTTTDGKFAGTLQYAAPEVLSGHEADARSDVYSLGVVLSEMVSGKSASPLQHVIDKCLARDPEERWESAHDVAEELRWIAGARGGRMTKPLAIAVAALLIVVVAAITAIVVWRARQTPRRAAVHLSIPLDDAVGTNAPRFLAMDYGPRTVAISPDGKHVVYSVQENGARHLVMRDLESFESVAIAGTAGASGPAFSPDGQWIAFSTGARALAKIAVTGGSPQVIFAGLRGSGGGFTWGPNNTIYFSLCASSGCGLWKVGTDGGPATMLTRPNVAADEVNHSWPSMLPDGRHLLFTIRKGTIDTMDDAEIALLSLDSGKWRVVMEGGTDARYFDGQILFGRGGSLYAVAFDLNKLAIAGASRRVLSDVVVHPSFGSAHYDVSASGDLVYAPGGTNAAESEILQIDAAGKVTSVAKLNFAAISPRVSPDGRKFAVQRTAANDSIWVYDVESGIASRLSRESGDALSPVWTADGSTVIYVHDDPSGITRMIARPLNGGKARELLRSTHRLAAGSCSPDGMWLAYTDWGTDTDADIWLLRLHGEPDPRPFVQTAVQEVGPEFSPDGQWIAYARAQNGPAETYIRSIVPGTTRELKIAPAATGGFSHDGKRFYYWRPPDLFSVPLNLAGGDVRIGPPQVVTSMPVFMGGGVSDKGIYVLRSPDYVRQVRQVNVILNWSDELRR